MTRVDVFEQSKEAYRVAVGKVTESRIEVSRVLKGADTDTIDIDGWPPDGPHTNCVYDPEIGTRVLVFVDEEPSFMYWRQSVMPVGNELQPPFTVTESFIDSLQTYIDADSDQARRDLFFNMLTNEKGELVVHAFQKIYEHPGWWDALTDDHLAEIRQALTETEYPEKKPFWMLVRLGDKKLFPVLLEQIDGPWTHMSAEALRVLLNRPLPDIQKHQANGTTEVAKKQLKEWVAEHPDDWFAAGYKRRGLSVPKTLEELADRIASGPSKVDRLVALAACERKTDSRLVDTSIYTDGVDSEEEWSRIASVCRVAGRAR
jgi:hypothetical protein